MNHIFSVDRPSGNASNPFAIEHAPHPKKKFQPLPPPSGKPPYHLDLKNIVSKEKYDAIELAGHIVLHTAGDTGGIKSPEPQRIVEYHMEQQFKQIKPADQPALFYHLGDVVYYNGESENYPDQFYNAYMHYPAPIVAIPGNHDGDLAPGSSVRSLDAFVRNFCAPKPISTEESGESHRTAMTQPNVYWTLLTPFVNIIGLYTNVPEGGVVEKDQEDWFMNELKTADKDKALILALHHPLYSGDDHHSGSHKMIKLFDEATKQAKRIPDLVLTGHVHNYQRFTRVLHDRKIPIMVAGAGGYYHLHYVRQQPDAVAIVDPSMDVKLEKFCDNRHGFMRIVATKKALKCEYFTVPRPHEPWRSPAVLFDSITIRLHDHVII